MSRVSTPVFCTIAYRRLAGREPVGLAELVQRLAYFVARHAPSPHNVQPWRVKLISDDCAELFIDGARTLRANASNPDGTQRTSPTHPHSTVTDLARFLGLSISVPRASAA